MMKKIYTWHEIANLSSEELLQELKSCWGYDIDKPLMLYGKLQKDKKEFEEIFFVNGEKATNYPKVATSDGVIIGKRIFIYLQDSIIPKDNTNLFECLVEVADEQYRREYEYPFLLCVKEMLPLQEIPEVLISQIELNDKKYIREWIYNAIEKEEYLKLDKKYEGILLDIAEEIKNKEKIIEENDLLQFQSKVLNKENAVLIIENKDLESQKKQLHSQITQQEHEMAMLQEKFQTLTRRLEKLGLIDEGVLEIENRPDMREGVTFQELNEDFKKTVAYIQAYMYEKGILYERKVLEDFFTLLSTHDLIILAGDSGSGKTKLVTSFAEAIGGVAKVIPVKPNWTSAEDLLGYYNPMEHRFLSTDFLETLQEATLNPTVPYFICLDEMNLARVEYYFADFLSLLEKRDGQPLIPIFTSTEERIIESEVKNFLALVSASQNDVESDDIISFVEIIQNEELNDKLQRLCGLNHGDSLLKYHSYLRKRIDTHLSVEQKIKLPTNVRFIGAINIDETTHYLSPKILDRAHIIRFKNPLLLDYAKIKNEITYFEYFNITQPLKLDATIFGTRSPYPRFSPEDELISFFLNLVKRFLEPLGIEFSYRTVGQACLYRNIIKELFNESNDIMIYDAILLHKVLPKLLFDGQKKVEGDLQKADLLQSMRNFLEEELGAESLSVKELSKVIENAENNDWTVNYWTK